MTIWGAEEGPDCVTHWDGDPHADPLFLPLSLSELAGIMISAHEDEKAAQLTQLQCIRAVLHNAGPKRGDRAQAIKDLASACGGEYESLRKWARVALRFTNEELSLRPALTLGHAYEAANSIRRLPGETATSESLRERSLAVLNAAEDNNLSRAATQRQARVITKEAYLKTLPTERVGEYIEQMERPEPYFEQFLRDFAKAFLAILKRDQPGTFSSVVECAVQAFRSLRGKWNISPAD
jgi:hypothetical protein